jgi:hypothetical protein
MENKNQIFQVLNTDDLENKPYVLIASKFVVIESYLLTNANIQISYLSDELQSEIEKNKRKEITYLFFSGPSFFQDQHIFYEDILGKVNQNFLDKKLLLVFHLKYLNSAGIKTVVDMMKNLKRDDKLVSVFWLLPNDIELAENGDFYFDYDEANDFWNMLGNPDWFFF